MTTVFVVGAGRFGRNYIKVLSGWKAAEPGQWPTVDILIVSRTQATTAQAMAAEIAAQPTCPFKQVIGVAVADEAQLRTALDHHQPDLTCIVARDRVRGDDIHAAYALPALDVGAVLCEKPFCRAGGEGAGLAQARALLDHPRADRFGLELPMFVMARAMFEDPRLESMLRQAKRIDYVWQKPTDENDLLDDLALHPWSLIPNTWQTNVEQVTPIPGGLEIGLRLQTDGPDRRVIPATIRLSAGGTFRGMRIDNQPFGFVFAEGRLQLRAYDAPWSALIGGEIPDPPYQCQLAVANPLAQHIQAVLNHHPLVDTHQTYRSQQFLEAVRGRP
ncbi:Gfo/Idh/MocA family oxidoreductase [Desulfatitalea alkaliphila]|uniref:Gfo/Idh/MocA family oxidoreductase n=1 Tax=Desulfatitalea alkaliphila TaxID=2929485 RepID=A0AA41URD9_9BACT|nr:Gfo/Idh/MocA family oxidoreductase [Desulfatitalea alkaliphila]MCJ8502273.1 Gfo/Idh/MocA family oxidoreductase [Desulfatitalea alkaliphila]